MYDCVHIVDQLNNTIYFKPTINCTHDICFAVKSKKKDSDKNV